MFFHKHQSVFISKVNTYWKFIFGRMRSFSKLSQASTLDIFPKFDELLQVRRDADRGTPTASRKELGSNAVFVETQYAAAELQVIEAELSQDIIIPPSFGTMNRPKSIKSIVVPEQYFAKINDVVCVPRQVILRAGQFLPDSFRRRNSRHAHVQLDRVEDGRFRSRVSVEPQIVIEEPCFYFDGEHADHFGHFTLEVMSRLWPFRMIDLSSFVFITSAKPAVRHMQLLEPFGIKESQLRYFSAPVLCRDLLISSQGYILEGSVSSAALAVWDRIGEFYDNGTRYDKLYVSRSRWPKQRNLVNEAEIETFMQSSGFDVIHPETMSLPDQIRAFRHARLIAGPGGSGLYNCVYCQETGERIILAVANFVTLNDALVNTRTQSRITYLTGVPLNPGVPGMLTDWRIDAGLVREFMAQA